MPAPFRIAPLRHSSKQVQLPNSFLGEVGGIYARLPTEGGGPAGATVAAVAPDTSSDQVRPYMERLLKLIPAEVISVYLVGIGVIPADKKPVILVWAIVCLALVVLVRAYGTSDRRNRVPPEWPAVGVSVVSFVIWVYVAKGPAEAYGVLIPWVGSLAILLWTFVVPYFYNPKA